MDGFLIVDAGDMLTPVPGHLRDVRTPEQVKARAAIIAKMQAKIGLHAAAVGERDLALGLKELRRLQREHRLRFLAANLVDEKGNPAFEAGFVTEVAGVKVGLLGLTDVPEGQAGPIREAGLTMRPFVEAAAKEAARLRGLGAAVVVALAHTGVSGARTLLQKVPDIDVAVVGHTSTVTPPTRVGSGYFVEAQRQGKQIGELILHVVEGQRGFVDAGRRRELAEQIGRDTQSYERLAKLVATETIATRRDLYLRRLADLRRSVTEKCAQAAEPDPPGANWLEHTFAVMGRSVPDDPEVAKAIQAYKEKAPKGPPEASSPPPGVGTRQPQPGRPTPKGRGPGPAPIR